jgi:alginate O-acetyltransferase complex protein AlgJ
MSQRIESEAGASGGRRDRDSWLLIAVFAVLLLVPATAQLVGLGAGSGENRVLAEAPRFTVKQIKNFSKAADAYVNDRFGLRQQLVQMNSRLRYRLGVSSNKDVVIGRGGWLFYTDHKLMEQHTGANVFTPAELENWVARMEAARDWLARRGVSFYVMIVPDKNSVYPENLPQYPRRPGTVTRFDQLAERLGRSSLDFIDPRAALVRAKAAGAEIYIPGDTHWTERGAFIAYDLLMDRVRVRYHGIQPLTLDGFKSSHGAPMASDLARLLGLEGELAYTVERLTPLEASRQVKPMTVTNRPGWPWALNEIDNDLEDRPRLLVYGDSFTSYVLGPHFLYETFRDPVYTNHHGGTLNLALVDEFKPDIVVMQMAERYLYLVPQAPVGAAVQKP